MTKIDLGPHFEKFVRKQLESGQFDTESEVVREALRLLEEQQSADRAEALADIRAKIRESLDDARPSVPAEEVFARLRAKLRGMKIDRE